MEHQLQRGQHLQQFCHQGAVWWGRAVRADLVRHGDDDVVGGDSGRAGLHGRRILDRADWGDGVAAKEKKSYSIKYS